MYKFLFGSNSYDSYVICEFALANIANNKDKVNSMLQNESNPVRDMHIIGGLRAAIFSLQRVNILPLLLSNDRVKNCIRLHPNLQTYREETSDLGIVGSLFSLIPKYYKPYFKRGYNNLLTDALNEYVKIVNYYGITRKNTRLVVYTINILLKLGLFDVNQENCEVSILSSKKWENRRGDKEWAEYACIYAIVTKTPLYMACEIGDVSLVKRILKENNLNLNKGLTDKTYFTSTSSGIERFLSRSKKTPLQIAKEKGFKPIVTLLDNYKLSAMEIRGMAFFRNKQYNKAFPLLKKIAEQSEADDAQFCVGYCYEKGVGGVKQDYASAVRYYQFAAYQGYLGNTEAQFRLGRCYQLGNGVEQNYEKAMQHYEFARSR